MSNEVLNAKYPVYVLCVDCGDVLRFESAREMQGCLEAIDVENGEYLAWERDGIPVALKADGKGLIHFTEPQTKDHPRLLDALVRYAANVGIEDAFDGLRDSDFQTLFQRIQAHVAQKQKDGGILSRILRMFRRT